MVQRAVARAVIVLKVFLVWPVADSPLCPLLDGEEPEGTFAFPRGRLALARLLAHAVRRFTRTVTDKQNLLQAGDGFLRPTNDDSIPDRSTVLEHALVNGLQRGIASALGRCRHHLTHGMTRNEWGVTPSLRVHRACVVLTIVGMALYVHGLRRMLLLLLHRCLGRLGLRLRCGLGLDGNLYLLLRLRLGWYGRGRRLLCPRLLGLMRLLHGGHLVGLVGLVWLVSLMRLVGDVLRLMRH